MSPRLAVVMIGAVVAAAVILQRDPSPPPPVPVQESPIVWEHSAWAEAQSRKGHFRLLNYDPGMAPGITIPLCKECDGLGGQYIPEPKRKKGERDMTHCNACDGTGERGLR